MKKLLLFALAACLPFSVALAQDVGYDLWYGNTDGSVVNVGLDKDIFIECWVQTDATNLLDSIGVMHNALGTVDSVIVARLGGTLVPFIIAWDDESFTGPFVYAAGKTNQSILGFCDLGGDYNQPLWSATPFMVGSFRMHTANVPEYVTQTFCALEAGADNANGATYWGNQTGGRTMIPFTHFSCLYFSPNQPPEWGANPGPIAGEVGVEVCFDLTGTDPDVENTLTITGPYGFTATGTGGAIAAQFCHTYMATGTFVEHFDLTDGSETVGMDVEVTVGATIFGLDIQGEDGACVLGYPGTDVTVNVTLHTNYFDCGGFELLIRWDPTALQYMNTTWLPRVNGGNEYHNIIPNAEGPGTAKFVWIADINNGIPADPAFWDVDAAFANSFLGLNFHVVSGLPFGMVIPVTFEYTGDFRDNSVSDPSGYDFVVPPSLDGCVEIFDFDGLRGDPNMNCLYYEIADAVLVADRLITGLIVWTYDDAWPASPTCTEAPFDRHDAAFNGAQEAASDLNDNGFCDVGDLVWFINIINDIAFPPKMDPVTGLVGINMNNGIATINSGVAVGAALVRVEGDITPVANGMDMKVSKANGMTTVLVYSLDGSTIAAGTNTLFTYTGEGEVAEVSVSDAYGRLLDASARPVLPTQFAVQQNYPNPFNAKTLINFDLPVQSDVTISIYNIAGQLVETINGNYAAGHQQITWDAAGVASGVYFAKVSTGDNTQTIKMTMLK